MHDQESTVAIPHFQPHFSVADFGMTPSAGLPTTFVAAEYFGESGVYCGPSLGRVGGNLSFPENLGDISITGGMICTGDLSIGKGTTLHLMDDVTAGGSINGDGSLEVRRGGIKAHSINLGGDLRSGLGVESKCVINVGGSLVCEDYASAGNGINVGGNLTTDADITCTNGDVRVRGFADVGIAIDAGNVEVGGNLSCWWLKARGSVAVGGSITVLEDIRADRSISAKGHISVGWRIFAGMLEGTQVQRKDQLIKCTEVINGKIACGELRLRA
jgi:hypothetical protein